MAEYLHALPKGFRLGNYELQRVIGAGAFGITYLARDANYASKLAIKEYLPVDVAVRRIGQGVKVLPISSREKRLFDWGLSGFLSEAKLLRRFSHKNIVRVLRHFRANGTGYIVMEHVAGSTLAHLQKNKGRLREDELRALLFPILDGLKTIHEKDYLHRDLKPTNIIVRDNGSPVILDFGAARQALIARSRSVTSLVTPGYSPIEQYASSGKQGPWSDIYALGAVAYRSLVGSPPPAAPERLLYDTLDGWTERVSGVSRGFLHAIDQSLAINGTERPKSVTAWSRMLGRASQRPKLEPQESNSKEMASATEPQWQEGIDIAAIWAGVVANLTVIGGEILGLSRRAADALRAISVRTAARDVKATFAKNTIVMIGLTCSFSSLLLVFGWLAIAPADGTLEADSPTEFTITSAELTDAQKNSRFESPQHELFEPPTERHALIWTKTFAGHSGGIHALAFSPGGRFLATSSADKTTLIWSVSTGEKLLTLGGQESAATAVTFLPNGGNVATGYADSAVRIWDTASGEQRALLSGHYGQVNSVAASPDEAFLLTSSSDGTARLWRLDDGRHLATLSGHNSSVVSARFSPDGSLIATGAFDNTVRLWDSSLGLHLATLSGTGAVGSAEFSPDGKRIMAGYHNGGALVWNLDSRTVVETFTNQASAAQSAVWSPGGNCIAIASFDGTLALWTLSPSRLVHRISAHEHPLSAAAFSPEGQYVATASSDGEARLWQVPEDCA